MAKVLRALDRLIRLSAIATIAVSSALMLLVAVLITADVGSSGLLSSPIPVVTELSAASLAVIVLARSAMRSIDVRMSK